MYLNTMFNWSLIMTKSILSGHFPASLEPYIANTFIVFPITKNLSHYEIKTLIPYKLAWLVYVTKEHQLKKVTSGRY